ncbi:MAG: hypothetical protein GY856_05235 [bacterium]|nr:hypothetical protein [bacterium]
MGQENVMTDLDLTPFRFLIDGIVVPARRHVRETVMPIAVPLALSGILLAVAQLRWLKGMASGDPEAFGEFFAGFFLFMLLTFAVTALYGLALSALTTGAMQAVSGRPRISMIEAWVFVVRPSVLGTLILIGMASFISSMMCWIPALYVVPVLSFALPAMADEGLRGFAALQRGITLAHFNPTGRWTHTPWLQMLLILVVGLVLNYALTLVVQLPFIVVQQLIILREAAAGQIADPGELAASTFWLQVPANVLNALTTAVTWLYSAFGICLLFQEVRRRKEARDLEIEIARLTGRSSEDSPSAGTGTADRVPPDSDAF